MKLSPWMLVPYPARVAIWVGVLLALWWAWSELDGALDRHYTSAQNAMVAEDAARANLSRARIAEARTKKTEELLAARDRRIAQLMKQGKEQDDEMERLKAEKPEVREWAGTRVPDAVRARHGVR